MEPDEETARKVSRNYRILFAVGTIEAFALLIGYLAFGKIV